jgi:hypothetical protein
LAAPHISSSKNPFHVGRVLFVLSFDVTARIRFEPKLVYNLLLRANKPHREEH